MHGLLGEIGEPRRVGAVPLDVLQDLDRFDELLVRHSALREIELARHPSPLRFGLFSFLLFLFLARAPIELGHLGAQVGDRGGNHFEAGRVHVRALERVVPMALGELPFLLLHHLLGGGELLLALLVLGVALTDALVDGPFQRAGVLERRVELDRLIDLRGGLFEIVALEGRACIGEQHFDRLLMIERMTRAVDQRMDAPVVRVEQQRTWSQASTAVPNSPASKAVCASFR